MDSRTATENSLVAFDAGSGESNVQSGADHPLHLSRPLGELKIQDMYETRKDRLFLFAQDPDNRIEAVEVPLPASPEYRFELLQKWEGIVTIIDEHEFSADLRDLTDDDQPIEVATFELDEVSEGDQCLLELGAVFYWSIGYEVGVSGQKKRVSLIRFRRLANWTRAEVAVVANEAAELERAYGLPPAH